MRSASSLTRWYWFCDFGGGTSDFSLIRFERRGSGVGATPIGHAGVAVAGDNFDYQIIDAVVSPLLGKGTQFKSIDKILPIAQHYHASFARWHQLAMLKTPEHLRELEYLRRTSLSPHKISMFLDIICNDWGFNISRGFRHQGAAVLRGHRHVRAQTRRAQY